jgi:hypothetical protein
MIHQRLIAKKNCQIGVNEMDWLQTAIEKNLLGLFGLAVKYYGVAARYDESGGLSTEFEPYDAGSGQVGIRAGAALNDQGQLIVTTETLLEDVPADGVWRKILLRPVESGYEPGTISLDSGTKNVVGVGTEFTRLIGRTGSESGRGDLIEITTESDNDTDGPWEIDSITDDTNLVLVNNASATENDIQFSVGGRFRSATPANIGIHRMIAGSLVISDSPQTGDILIGKVKNNSGSLTIHDLRQAHMLTLQPAWPMVKSCPVIHLPLMAAGTVIPLMLTTVAATDGTGQEKRFPSIIETDDGYLLCAYGKVADNALVCKRIASEGLTGDWAAASEVNIVASGYAGYSSALAKLPDGTLLALYTEVFSTKIGIGVKKSTNDGTSWGSPVQIYEDAGHDIKYAELFYSHYHGKLFCVMAVEDTALRIYQSDDGTDWELLEAISTTRVIYDIRMREFSDGTLAIMFGDSDTSRVFSSISTDGGSTWSAFLNAGDMTFLATGAESLAMEIIDDTMMIIFQEGAGAYVAYSGDRGSTWKNAQILWSLGTVTSNIRTWVTKNGGLQVVICDADETAKQVLMRVE